MFFISFLGALSALIIFSVALSLANIIFNEKIKNIKYYCEKCGAQCDELYVVTCPVSEQQVAVCDKCEATIKKAWAMIEN